MSTSDLFYTRVIDPRLDVNNLRNKNYGILAGAPYQTGRILPSTSFSDSQINWNAPPPSINTYTDRRFWTRVQFTLTFTGQSAGPGVTLLQAAGMNTAPGVSAGTAYYDAPRCMPLTQAIQNIQFNLGNQGFGSNLSRYSRIYSRYQRDEFQEDGSLSMSPSMPDQSQAYSELDGFNRNPLASYKDNVSQYARGSFADCIITRNDSTGAPGDIAIVQLTVTEALAISPLAFDAYQEEVAFIGVDMMQIQLQLGGRGSGPLTGLAQSLWSHSTLGSTLATAAATVNKADILFNYLTPSKLQSLPSVSTYSYFEPTLYPTQSQATLNPGQSTVISMSAVTLPSIPNCIYVFVCPQDSQTNITDTDTFCSIDNINITFANMDGILSNFSPQQLYQMCVKNGLNYSYSSFRQQVGAVVAIKFGTDIPLQDSWAPGVRTAQTLQMNVTVTNIHPTKSFIPQLNILAFQEGIVTINNGAVSKNIGVLDEKEVVLSWDQPALPAKPSHNIFGSALMGGGFWDDVGTFFKRLVGATARPAFEVAKTFVPGPANAIVSQAGDTLLKSYGLGLGRRRGGMLMGPDDY